MPEVITESRENVVILRLNHEVPNAISPAMVADLESALGLVEDRPGGLVLAGGSKFFCIGFDLPQLLELDRDGMEQFLRHFDRVALRLFAIPCPTACAIAGHAVAGGTVLAVTCDYRFAAAGRKLLGLNEIRLGVPVPYLADLMLRQAISDRAASELQYRGEFITATEAHDIGLVDKVLPQTQVEDHAVEQIGELAALPRKAFAAIKASRTEAVIARYKQNHQQRADRFLDCWFAPQTQELLAEAAEKI